MKRKLQDDKPFEDRMFSNASKKISKNSYQVDVCLDKSTVCTGSLHTNMLCSYPWNVPIYSVVSSVYLGLKGKATPDVYFTFSYSGLRLSCHLVILEWDCVVTWL